MTLLKFENAHPGNQLLEDQFFIHLQFFNSSIQQLDVSIIKLLFLLFVSLLCFQNIQNSVNLWWSLADLIINPVLQLGKLVSPMALFPSSNPEGLQLLTHPSDTKIIRFLIIFYSLFGLLDLDDKKLV